MASEPTESSASVARELCQTDAHSGTAGPPARRFSRLTSASQERIVSLFARRSESASTSTNAELQVSRALEVFNAGEEVQTVAAIARSLGTPTVTATPASKSCIVTITVAWELSWYRYEVDLSDESAGALLIDRGHDQSELDGREQRDNVRTDDRGRLHLSGAATA